MAKAKKQNPSDVDWPACQLMLVIEPGPGARERLKAAFEQATVSAILIRPKSGDQLGAGEVKPLVDLAQDQGAAAILFDNVELAKTLRADGVHLLAGLSVREQVAAARAELGVDASIGVDAGASRHAAMEAGEAGAEYVAFGITQASADARAERDALIAWWGEIFEVPCVALDLQTADDVEAADHNGADFAGLIIGLDQTLDAVMQLVGDADMRLLGTPST
jgi:thiamine-phosphate pyrophosphorylase